MKTILIISVLLLINTFCTAQSDIVKGQYYKIPELKEAEGVWVGSTSKDDSLVFQIKSSKEFLKGPDIYMDRLIGKYFYYKNNILVEKYSEDFPSIGGIDKNGSKILVRFLLYDGTKQKGGDLTLELASLDSKVAKWTLTNKETIIINGLVNGKPWDSSFSVPTEIVLKKIN